MFKLLFEVALGGSIPLVAVIVAAASLVERTATIGIDYRKVKAAAVGVYAIAASWIQWRWGSIPVGSLGVLLEMAMIWFLVPRYMQELESLENPFVNLVIIFRMVIDHKFVHRNFWKARSMHYQDRRARE